MDPQVFIDTTLEKLDAQIQSYKERDWRFTNLCGSTVENQVELLYTFSAGEEMENLRVLVDSNQVVPAVSPVFPVAFYFENEVHDLFGISFEGIAIDFEGTFFKTSVPTPMNPASASAEQYLLGEESTKSLEAAAGTPLVSDGDLPSSEQADTQDTSKEVTNG